MWSSKFSKFSSTSALIFALILLLALTWVLSFRPVRLKIGDYYFNQGKFNQAVNWYEKVIRKGKLKIDQNRGDRLIYGGDLSKLKSSLILVMEENLLSVSQLLGFEQAKDLKTILTDQKLFLADINELIGAESKVKMRTAKEELANFNIILDNYKKHDEIKTESRELGYLVSVGYLFKGIIDEGENNFVSADLTYEKAGAGYPEILNIFNERRKKILFNVADEYFYRSPLDWTKAKHLYESHIKSGNINNVNLFFILGYIYAKSNNFSISYDYFKKAYDLLEDNDLKKTIDHFKNKRTFLYPDDMRLIPKNLTKQYPLFQEISFFETKNLLNIFGISVTARSDGFIGKTGIKSPVDIIIRSAGARVGNYGQILINGNNVSQNRRGYNIVVLNPKNGKVEMSKNFDTHGSKDDVKKMIEFINGIEKGKIVCVAVLDEASRTLSKEDGEIFEKFGSKENLYGKHRWSCGIIGVKGSRYGEAIEAIDDKPIEIYVLISKEHRG